MRIVYFGTPYIAAAILSKLLDLNLKPVAIVTKPDKPIGRSKKLVPPAVKITAQEKLPDVPIHQPERVSTPEMEEVLRSYDADVFLVVAYGEILKPSILQIPRHKCINVHASLLPKLRGASPIQQAIIEGHTESGITIMEMVEKMDAGDIFGVAKVEITPDMTAGELTQELIAVTPQCLVDVLHKIESGSAVPMPQNHEEATYVKKIRPEHCEINWNQPAQSIHDLVRGLQPKPGAYCFTGDGKRLKIHKTHLVEGSATPGSILQFSKQGIHVAAKHGVLSLDLLQLEGKRSMTAQEFVSGFQKLTLRA